MHSFYYQLHIVDQGVTKNTKHSLIIGVTKNNYTLSDIKNA